MTGCTSTDCGIETAEGFGRLALPPYTCRWTSPTGRLRSFTTTTGCGSTSHRLFLQLLLKLITKGGNHVKPGFALHILPEFACLISRLLTRVWGLGSIRFTESTFLPFPPLLCYCSYLFSWLWLVLLLMLLIVVLCLLPLNPMSPKPSTLNSTLNPKNAVLLFPRNLFTAWIYLTRGLAELEVTSRVTAFRV